MIEIKDQMNNVIRLGNFPKRIISLVPSQTELLYDFGLENEVIGITKFCIHPKLWFENKTRVGGTKNIDFEKVKELIPDLIIVNKEENTKEMIEMLQADYPVYVSDIYTISDALEMIKNLGVLTNKKQVANEIVSKISDDSEKLKKINGTVLYFMWNNPLMVAGNKTFIGDVIRHVGFTNAYDDSDGRYKEIGLEEIKKSTAEYLLLSSEPFPFKESHKEELESATGKKVIFVDGEIFSWYGSRMMKIKKYFESILLQVNQGNP